MKKFKAIIVDDEWLVREELKHLLDQYPEIIIIGEASNVPQSAKLIDELKPDVIFLDIQMPGETGFELLEKKNIESEIIFVTAYDEYAVQAFEINALDYLLKPITKDRLKKTIDRLLRNERTIFKTKGKVTYNDVLYLIIRGSLRFIKISQIKCLLAEGNYSYLYYKDNRKELVSKTLQDWEDILPEKYFIRIHRSTIVNFEYVQKVKKCQNNTHQVFVQDIEEPFMMSRRYAAKLKYILKW